MPFPSGAPVIYSFEEYSLDPGAFELRRKGQPVDLEPQVLSVLAHLIENRDRVVGKDELVNAVWQRRTISDSAINSRISAARAAVGDTGVEQRLIRTYYRRGFRFVGEVDVVQNDRLQMTPSTFFPGKKSIAVLPFQSLAGGSEQDAFAEGIWEDLLIELSRNDDLVVIGRQSASAFKGTKVSAKCIGEELGVRYLIEGSVRRSEDRVRITAELIETDSGQQLWADRFDRKLVDVFEIQEAVTRAIADRLAVRLKPESVESRHLPTNNLVAYELFSRARTMIVPPSRDNLMHARQALERVIALDPDFAGGYAGLSTVYSHMVMFRLSSEPLDDVSKATELAEKAIRCDTRLGWPHIALGLSYIARGNHEAAIAAGLRAVEVQPSDPEANAFFGHFLFLAGEGERAIEPLERAMALNPMHFRSQYLNFLANAYLIAGRYTESVEALERNLLRGGPIYQPALTLWTVALYCAGREEEAKAKAKELLQMAPSLTVETAPLINMFALAEHRELMRKALAASGIPEE